MQIILNIDGNGEVTTEVKPSGAVRGAVPVPEGMGLGSDALDGGASPFTTSTNADVPEVVHHDSSEGLDGGPGLT